MTKKEEELEEALQGVPPEQREAVRAVMQPTEGIRERQDVLATALRRIALVLVIALAGLGLSVYNRYSQCESGNKFRQGDLKLWNVVFNLPVPPQPNETVEQKKQEAQNLATFKAFLKIHDEPTDCTFAFL